MTPLTWDRLELLPDIPVVLKGETNSLKYVWNTHAFARNKREAIEVHGRLTRDSLTGSQKIYAREYVPLETFTMAPQGLPITREFRFFVYKSTILSGGFYWSSHTEELHDIGIRPDPDEVPREFLDEVIRRIQETEQGTPPPPSFYVVDVAKTEEGGWIVIELNDGQMSGLSDNDPGVLYSNLKKAIDADISWS